jgi:orotate phosphoribosyltransferase
MGMSEDARRSTLIQGLRAYGVLEGTFELKSGRQASWFIDTKRAICRPPYLGLVAELALEVLDPHVVAVGGLTMGADPVAFATAALAQRSGRPLKAFSVRKEAKGYGQGGRIAGALDEGDLVCVVEDTPSRGTSLAAAVAAVTEAGAQVIQTLAVVDRGGTAARVVAPVPFVALLTAPDLGLPYDGGLEG